MSSWLERVRSALAGPRDLASRDYRYMALRLQREFPTGAGRGLCLALSAPQHDELTAEVALMLAHSLANELGSRVLVVDTRVRPHRRGLTEWLRLQGRPGFAEAMAAGAAQAAQDVVATRVERVDALPAGVAQQPVQVTPDRLGALLDWARSQYAYVLLAVGPVQDDTRHLLTAAAADLVFMLARENHTLMRNLEDGQVLLRRSGAAAVRTVVVGAG